MSRPADDGPPALAVRLLERWLPERTDEGFIGDLHEIFHADMVPRFGRAAARRWYWGQAVRALLGITAADLTHELPPPGYRRKGGLLPNLSADLRHAVRQMRRAPFFTAIVVMILAAGIGVNAVMIAMVDTAAFHPIPGVADVRNLVMIELQGVPGSPGWLGRTPRWREFADFRGQQTAFDLVGAASRRRSEVVITGSSISVELGSFATPEYLEALRPVMHLGRPFTADGSAAQDQQVVVSHRFWRDRLGADPAALGRVLQIGGHAFTLIGVTGTSFTGLVTGRDGHDAAALWLPFAAAARLHPEATDGGDIGASIATVIGRVRPELSLAQAGEAAALTAQRIGGNYSLAAPLAGAAVRSLQIPLATLLLETVMLSNLTLVLLLIAGSNVSILLLGRAVMRRREIAVRLALGASRGRVIRLLLVESMLLALTASTLGLLLASGCLGFINSYFPNVGFDLQLSWRSIVATALFAAITGVFFGVLPALHATRSAVGDALKSGGSGGDRSRTRLQRGFVVAEVALSMGLVCAAILLVRALRTTVNSGGYERSSTTLVADLDFLMAKTTPEEATAVIERTRKRLLAHPGVDAVSFTTALPDVPVPAWTFLATGGGVTSDPLPVEVRRVAPDYFRALGVPRIGGRDFTAQDVVGAPRVIIIDHAVAEAVWPGRDAIGRDMPVIRTVSRGQGVVDTLVEPLRVAGVVGTAGVRSAMALGVIYFPLAQGRDGSGPVRTENLTLVVRTVANAGVTLAAIPGIIHESQPTLPVTDAQSLADRHRASNIEWRGVSRGGMVAGGLALVLACVGIYAVIAFAVSQRMREIGIRVALGARHGQVIGLFFREGMRLAVFGIAIGLPLSLGAMHFVGRELHLDLLHPGAILAVAVAVVGVVAFASWLPARRATRVNPIEATRSE